MPTKLGRLPLRLASGGGAETGTKSVDLVTSFVERKKLRVHYVLETHAHADPISGAQLLRKRFGAQVAIGARITEVQAAFRDIFDLGAALATDGRLVFLGARQALRLAGPRRVEQTT